MPRVSLFLMSPPGPRWALRGRANFRSAEAAEVDPKRALREWLALADAIEARGGRVICLVPNDDTSLTGLPYAAEAGQLVEHEGELLFLLPNMAKPHRQGERELWKNVAEALQIKPISIDGLWEAQGDVAHFRDRTLLFFGGRTDRKGAESAARFFEKPLLLEIREPAFHGNMAVLPIASADRLLVCREVMSEISFAALEHAFGESAVSLVSEDEIRSYATNGLMMGREILAPNLLPARIAELLRSWGINVSTLPMDELCGKAGGASRCLVSVAEIEQDGVRIPPHLDFRVRRHELGDRAR